MKYAFLVGDGMADYPIIELGGRTPLEAARDAQHGQDRRGSAASAAS